MTGPSGSGKSTLLSVLAGLIEPDAGEIGPADRARHAGVVFQGYCLLPALTAAENVELPLQLQGVGPRRGPGSRALPTRWREPDSPTSRTGSPRSCPAASGSGSPSHVRSACDRASSIADEPTAELDAVTAATVFAALRAEADAGAAVVLATHDLDLAGLCDTVVHLVDGKVSSSPG